MKEKYIIGTFEWKSGSINDNIIKLLKEKAYPWHYNHFFQLEIDLFPAYYKVQYERIENDTFQVFV